MSKITTGATVNKKASLAIGVFDSGLGGLTVVRELKKILPYEDIIYLGDTARLPYGSKSPETIRRFSKENALFLARRGVKIIVVACHSASSVALGELEASFSLPIVGVLKPACLAAINLTKNGRIGIIGTYATIEAGTYERILKALNPNIEIIARPTPLLVPLVEEGIFSGPVTLMILKDYLQPLLREKIDTLLLGCTHYPLLIPAIRRVLKNKITLVDASQKTSIAIKEILKEKNLLNPQKNNGKITFYFTDLSPNLYLIARRFLNFEPKEVFRASLRE
jgi:glutamate racemase